jgi:serine/threonine protein phosphatase PrpC
LPTPVRSAQLRGPEHLTLSGIAAVAEGPVAIALSRGGAAKRYAHKEPNEDVAGFAWTEWGSVLAIADGHAGSEAARMAVERVIAQRAPVWLERAPMALDARWGDEVAALVRDLQHRIVAEAAGARTTLAIALARPREGWLGLVSVGDSLLFCAGDAGARAFGDPEGQGLFLGSAKHDPADLVASTWIDLRPLRGVRSVVLASDGFSCDGIGVTDPEATLTQALTQASREPAELRPLAFARDLVARALAAQHERQAGDNVAAAVLWLAS